ncbi:hypothetical protein G6F24_014524 [Rhizopus arrhizus]|nr:hypothetical protein G6F24_014524 [Rhizopus arrhizus]
MVAFLDRLEHGRAQRRGQAQRQQRREQDRHRHRHGELAVDRAHRAAGQRHRNEHRGQYQGDADHRAGQLAHRLDGGLARWQALLCHDPLHALDHHDRIVDDDADRQYHAEHGRPVARAAQRQHHREGAQQRDRGDQRRNQRIAPVLQEQVHHRKHQQHRFEQRLHHLLDRDLDERRGVERNARLHATRQQRCQLGHALAHCAGGSHRVRARAQLHAGRRRRMAVFPPRPANRRRPPAARWRRTVPAWTTGHRHSAAR